MLYCINLLLIASLFSVVFCDETDSRIFVFPCNDNDKINGVLLEYNNKMRTVGLGEYIVHVDMTQSKDSANNKLEILIYGNADFKLVDKGSGTITKSSSLYTTGIEITDLKLPDTEKKISVILSWVDEMPDLVSIKLNGVEICSPDLDVWKLIKEEQGVAEPVVAGSLECGRKKNGGVAQLLTNAAPTAPGDWPWHVALFKLDSVGFTQKYQCGATLVSKLTVVTASHCITSDNGALLSPESIRVFLGMYKLSGNTIPPQEREVFSLIKHPQFKPRPRLSNDIAIIRLKVEAQYNIYVQPACLWDMDHTDKSEIIEQYGTLVGWGVNENNVLSTTLQKAQLPVIRDITCVKKYPDFYSKYVTDFTFCAGYTNGTSACNGDSGGGLMFSKNQVWFLRGIVSLSITKQNSNICDTSYYVVFTDAAKYVDWIRRYM